MTAIARARRIDPETSHLAARQMEIGGLATQHRQAVAELVRRHPGSTSAELAAHSHGVFDRFQTARRLKEIEEDGDIRRGAQRACLFCDRVSLTWWPNNTTPAQPAGDSK